MEELKAITGLRPDAPLRKRRKTFIRVGVEWVLRELMRLRLAVWLLIVMAVTMIVGSIFPQGYEADTYISSWGEARYQVFSRLGLLNLFHTKFFKLLGIILLLNLIVCSVVRLSGRRRVRVEKTAAPKDARPIAMGGDADSAISKAVRALTERGYYVARAAGGVLTARRGPWPEGVSLLYHLALAIAIIGFLVSALHSYEGSVTLYPDQPVVVKTGSLDTGWHGIRHGFASLDFFGWYPFDAARPDTTEWEGEQVTLTLNEFRTEWELYQEKYYPKDWLSDVAVDVKGHGPEVLWPSRLVEVNRPLRAGGLTFYQMAYEQEFDCVVWSDGEEVERVRANAYVPFTLESIEGMFFPGTMRVGTLYQKYMPIEPVVPHVPLSWQPPEPPVEEVAEVEPEPAEPEADEAPPDEAELADVGADTTGAEMAEADTVAPPPTPMPERIELGDLSAGEPLEVEGFTLTLENPYEGSVLTYRHDRGVPMLYIAITLFILGLAIRSYWPSYRVSLWIEEVGGKAVGKLVFRATGMLGEPEVVERQLVGDLGVPLKRQRAQVSAPAQPKTPAEGAAAAAATPGKGGPATAATLGESGPATAAPTDSQEPGRAPEVKPPGTEPPEPGKYPLRDALPEDDDETPSSS